MNIRITVQYDGTAYKGWQVQGNTENTIQGKLQNVLSRLAGEPIEVHGSGRTDAGVHAKGQVANFRIEQSEEVLSKLSKYCPDNTDKALLLYINEHLPLDIAVTDLTAVDDRFHARLSAKSKTYQYRIYVNQISDVFQRKYVYTYLDKLLDVDAMKRAAKFMMGEHDFKSFCGNSHMKKSTVRNVTDISICVENDENGPKEIVIEYSGNGFLQNMVRIMTGTLIEVGSGQKQASDIVDIIGAKDRKRAGYTAPAQGLCLVKVEY